ncbi:uncharacterized protein MELLADRAFT_62748 [Melampsora larici-populina 98AG31]|uniref:F-box domain-containing protein n=1 Tax=Melampsora larici-populina (strain 98AG31 / pathotype 3-4-7) TaxID=747676 RepID=F4RK32_MELLP|nr:uncharacterized protein MELLADRAFT_62748 [Melampsora larici-populina 98AG31]EGG07257.1 hypothetical protein MELLADRAFT_62748 [Melampsora larici-populina 98AG31]
MRPGSNYLPVELVQLILGHYMRNMPFHPSSDSNTVDVAYLDFSSIRGLLNLRFLGRSWAVAILPLAYRSLCLFKSSSASSFVMMWKNPLSMPSMVYLQRLCLAHVQFLPCHMENDSSLKSRSSYRSQVISINTGLSDYVIQMDVVTDLVALCSSTLVDLKLSYREALGFSKPLIDAMKGLTKLKVLILDSSSVASTRNNSDSLRQVLNSLPSLESLSIGCASFDDLTLQTGALPNLHHLWVECNSNNVDAITNFCRTAGRNVKFFECRTHRDMNKSSDMILALRPSLKILSLGFITHVIPLAIGVEVFPRLRVIRAVNCDPQHSNLSWLLWRMFDKMEYFITTYHEGGSYWRTALKRPNVHSLQKPRNFKYIIFTSCHGSGQKDPELVELCAQYGLLCIFRH